jgi:hypothetical protein
MKMDTEMTHIHTSLTKIAVKVTDNSDNAYT